MFGHIHRREYLEDTIWSDMLDGYKPIFAYNPGCLCRVDGSVPGSSALNGWTQGIGLIVTEDGVDFIRDMPYNSKVKRFLK